MRFRSLIVLPLFMLVAATSAAAQEPPRACPAVPAGLEGSVERLLPSHPGDLFAVLKNGLTVLIRQKPDSDVVSSQVFVHTGSIYEGKYLNAGLSHYLEHVVSGGSTRAFTEAQAKERLRKMGGETNAYTTYDRTVYYIDTSAENWKGSLDLLLSYVSQCNLDPQEVAREKSVIQQEIKLGENNPNGELWKLFLKTAYQVHPVRNPVIGYEEVFVQQDRQALLDYYTHRYRPDNMVVVVVGNINPTETLQFIAEKTAGFTRTVNEPVVWASEPPQIGPRWDEKEVPIARLTQAMIGFPSVTIHDPDLYALDVLALLMGQGESCRLYCRLKDQEKQVLSISASDWTPSFVRGQLIISVSLPPENWPRAMESIEDEINRFKTDLVGPQELEKAKKAIIAEHIFGKDSASAMAGSLGGAYLDTGNPYFDAAYVEAVRRVTPEEIRSVAQRYLLPERMNVAVIHPPQPQAAAQTAAPACPAAPAAQPVKVEQLGNGLKVLLKQDNSLPFVTIQLYGSGGLALEQPDKPGLAAFTASLLTAGTANRTKLDIIQAIEDRGGSIEAKSDNSTYHISIKLLKEDLDLGLDILSDIAQNAKFPEEEIAKKRDETLLAIQRQDESWQSEIVRLFKANYFDASPYRNDRLGTAASVQSFTRKDVLDFYQRMVNPAHSVLAVFGDIDQAAVLKTVQTRFNPWTGPGPVQLSLPDETQRLSADRVVEKKNEKVSASLFIGTNGLSIDDKIRPVLDVLDAVLTGASTPSGRLFEALRGGNEDLVYVVSAFPFYGRNAGYFGVITQTTKGNLDKVQGIILEHLKRLGSEAVPAEEFAEAKTSLLTAHRLERERLETQAQTAAVDEVLGLGWNYDQNYDRLIEAVTPQQVQQLAQKLFAHTLIVRTIPEHPVEILAHPNAKADTKAP